MRRTPHRHRFENTSRGASQEEIQLYGLTSKSQRFAESARQIAIDVALPAAEDVDSAGRFPSESMDALARSGLLGLCVEEAAGGIGEGPRAFAAVTEELATACGSTAMIYVMHVTAAQAIASSNLLDDRTELLAAIAAGKHLSTLAFSEKGSRSQFWAPVSKLTGANGEFATTASKSWVTAARHASSYVSSGQRPGAASPLESVVYLARPKAAGVEVTDTFNGLGLRGNESAPVAFEQMVVRNGDFISPLGEGANTMLQVVLPWFSIGTAAMANGLCRAAVSATSGHLMTTRFEHDGTALRDLPNLRARIAQMSVRTEQSRALLAYTLGLMENPSEITPLYVLQSRLAALEAAVDVTDLAMKACGGAAFSKHLPIERLFRDARAGWVMAPTVDHLRDFIGRALTGLPLF
ncbi:MAG TPA: acyl-CoA dehydrogenase family protein [Thermoanaerobaculia bacterium]|nr:acyl-CoA dehydrogenase family protein [Thermoanaerobaculia bacterium]